MAGAPPKIELVPEGAERAPLIQSVEIEHREVACPHCKMGFAVFPFQRPATKNGRGVTANCKELRQCNTCRKPFHLKPIVQFVGAKPGE